MVAPNLHELTPVEQIAAHMADLRQYPYSYILELAGAGSSGADHLGDPVDSVRCFAAQTLVAEANLLQESATT